MFPLGALSRPSAAIATASVRDSTLDLPCNLDTLALLRARVMTPERSAARASPEEIHRSLEEAAGEKSCFNRSIELLVNFHLVIADDTNKN
jgi:hypothetical protein